MALPAVPAQLRANAAARSVYTPGVGYAAPGFAGGGFSTGGNLPPPAAPAPGGGQQQAPGFQNPLAPPPRSFGETGGLRGITADDRGGSPDGYQGSMRRDPNAPPGLYDLTGGWGYALDAADTVASGLMGPFNPVSGVAAGMRIENARYANQIREQLGNDPLTPGDYIYAGMGYGPYADGGSLSAGVGRDEIATYRGVPVSYGGMVDEGGFLGFGGEERTAYTPDEARRRQAAYERYGQPTPPPNGPARAAADPNPPTRPQRAEGTTGLRGITPSGESFPTPGRRPNPPSERNPTYGGQHGGSTERSGPLDIRSGADRAGSGGASPGTDNRSQVEAGMGYGTGGVY